MNRRLQSSARGSRVETLRSPLNADVDLGRYPLALLNTALLEDGLVIRIAPGVDAGALDLRFAGGASATAVSRVRVELGAGSRLRLIEQRNEDRPTNSVLDVRIGADALLCSTRACCRQRRHPAGISYRFTSEQKQRMS